MSDFKASDVHPKYYYDKFCKENEKKEKEIFNLPVKNPFPLCAT